jgi:hypothetical protein
MNRYHTAADCGDCAGWASGKIPEQCWKSILEAKRLQVAIGLKGSRSRVTVKRATKSRGNAFGTLKGVTCRSLSNRLCTISALSYRLNVNNLGETWQSSSNPATQNLASRCQPPSNHAVVKNKTLACTGRGFEQQKTLEPNNHHQLSPCPGDFFWSKCLHCRL